MTKMVEEQVFDNNDTHLWMAVMDRAVRDLIALERYRQDPKVMEDPVFRYDYRTLKRWFHSSSMEPGSFNWICSLVSIDPKWALKRLEERLKVGLVPDAGRKARLEKELLAASISTAASAAASAAAAAAASAAAAAAVTAAAVAATAAATATATAATAATATVVAVAA